MTDVPTFLYTSTSEIPTLGLHQENSPLRGHMFFILLAENRCA